MTSTKPSTSVDNVRCVLSRDTNWRAGLVVSLTNRHLVPRIVHVLRAATIVRLSTFVINDETFYICNGFRNRALSDL